MAERDVVGVTYVTWHYKSTWRRGSTWSLPLCGSYQSDDEEVLKQHAEWLVNAGVDFVLMDWSNNCGFTYDNGCTHANFRFIQDATIKLFTVWTTLPKAPKVCILIGSPESAKRYTGDMALLKAKADEVYSLFVANEHFGRLYFCWKGKPLLVDYAGTPCPFQTSLPPWFQDSRFTVRHMTGYVTCQKGLVGPGGVSKYGYWSWEERFDPTYAIADGRPENMTVCAGHRGHHGWKDPTARQTRNDGWTFRKQWDRANAVGVDLVLVQSFNEWKVPGEELDPEHSNDIEPSRVQGTYYLEALKIEVQRFKALHGLAPPVPPHCLPCPCPGSHVAYAPLAGWQQQQQPLMKYCLKVHRVDLDLNVERNSRSLFIHQTEGDNMRFLSDVKGGCINVAYASERAGIATSLHQIAYDFPYNDFFRFTYWPIADNVQVEDFTFLPNTPNCMFQVSAFLDMQLWAPLQSVLPKQCS